MECGGWCWWWMASTCLQAGTINGKRLSNPSFSSVVTSCKHSAPEGLDKGSQPFQRLVYRWDNGVRAFRYATSNPYRVPTARLLLTSSLPAIGMAGYHCLMPTASTCSELAKLLWCDSSSSSVITSCKYRVPAGLDNGSQPFQRLVYRLDNVP